MKEIKEKVKDIEPDRTLSIRFWLCEGEGGDSIINIESDGPIGADKLGLAWETLTESMVKGIDLEARKALIQVMKKTLENLESQEPSVH